MASKPNHPRRPDSDATPELALLAFEANAGGQRVVDCAAIRPRAEPDPDGGGDQGDA
jgi:hypothetical protein